mgnify:FL=1
MSATHRSTKRSLRTLTLISGLLFAALGAGLYYWGATCPCDRTAGLVLLGDTPEDPVLDWTFAN